MYCSKCSNKLNEKARFCSTCGTKVENKSSNFLIFLLIMVLLFMIGIFSYLGFLLLEDQSKDMAVESDVSPPITQVEVKDKEKEESEVVTKRVSVPKSEGVAAKEEDRRELTDIIAASQNKVFTVYTAESQGSAFLINQKGDLLTNAHVVEGNHEVEIYDMQGNLFFGTVIGYSNDTDVAIVRVPQLEGSEPLPLEKNEKALIGEEVIALGSPQGFSNTATLGYISGIDRTFLVEPHIYENVYQISAPIAPGSSGGPLLSKQTGKVMAINSARHSQEAQIGFSIPLYSIMELIQGWVDSPLTSEHLVALYYENYNVYFSETDDYGYFDDGYYEEDYDGYDYWDYESGDSLEDNYFDEEQFFHDADGVITDPSEVQDDLNGKESPNEDLPQSKDELSSGSVEDGAEETEPVLPGASADSSEIETDTPSETNEY